MTQVASTDFVSTGSIADLFKDKAEHLIEESAIGYGRRGGARYDQGRLEEAIADFESALQLDPTASALWLQKALAHRKLGNIIAAREAYIAAADILEKKNPQFATKIRNGLHSLAALGKKQTDTK